MPAMAAIRSLSKRRRAGQDRESVSAKLPWVAVVQHLGTIPPSSRNLRPVAFLTKTVLQRNSMGLSMVVSGDWAA